MTERVPPPRHQVWSILFAIGTIGVLLVFSFLFVHIFQVLLIIFAAILVAVFLQGLTAWLGTHAHLPWLAALSLVVAVILAVVGGLTVLAGPQIVEQVATLVERIPDDLAQLRKNLAQYSWGPTLLEQLPPPEQVVLPDKEILGRLSGIFSTAVGAFANVVIVLLIGIYLTVSPHLYIQGALHLVPLDHRQRAREVLEALGHALHWWLVGRFAAMAAVGVLTVIALWLIDMPLPLALGFIAGLLSFIPYVGPIASAVPAVLVGLAQDPLTAVYVVVVYAVVQFLEGNFITPLIQKRAVALPPALLLTAQLLMGVLFGLLGLLLATPLAVVVIVLIQMLYVQDVLGDQIKVLGERHGH